MSRKTIVAKPRCGFSLSCIVDYFWIKPRWHHFVLFNHLWFILIPQDLFLYPMPLQGDCNVYHISITIYLISYFITYIFIYFCTWYLSMVMATVRKTLAASPRWQQHSATWKAKIGYPATPMATWKWILLICEERLDNS